MSQVENKSKRRRSHLWKHFTILPGTPHAKCNYCRKLIAYTSTTSNLRRHIEKKHLVEQGEIHEGMTQDFGEEIVYEVEDSNREEDVEFEIQSPTIFKVPSSKYTSLQNLIRKQPQTISNTYRPSSKTDMIQEAINILSNVARKNTTLDDSDEFSQFGKYVADQLRELPALNALQVQEKIYCFITRERIAVMKNNTELQPKGLKSVDRHQIAVQEETTDQNGSHLSPTPQTENSVPLEISSSPCVELS